jgi:hypothetical protein
MINMGGGGEAGGMVSSAVNSTAPVDARVVVPVPPALSFKGFFGSLSVRGGQQIDKAG